MLFWWRGQNTTSYDIEVMLENDERWSKVWQHTLQVFSFKSSSVGLTYCLNIRVLVL